MKKNLPKSLALLLAAALTCGLFAGCGGTSSSTAQSSAATTEETSVAAPEEDTTTAAEPAEATIEDSAEAPEASAEDSAVEPGTLQPVSLPIVDEAVHYTCWMPVAPYVSTMMDLEDFSESVSMVKTINEMTNVYIDFTAVAGGEVEEEAFNLMIAANDYTDIIGVMNYYSTGHEGAIEDGIILDIKDDLKEYAPNYWTLLTSDDNAYMTMLTDSGYMGCIAQLLKKAGTENQGMIIRKDWLEAAGMDIPTTMSEMEDYLTYCKDNYGAYAYIQYGGMDTDWGAAFNISPGSFNVYDGVVTHSYTTEAFKDYLTTMNDWYQKGLFSVEFYNDTDITTVRTDMANDLCSFVDGSAEGMSNIFDMNPDNTAMELVGIPYVTADGVDQVHVGYESSLIKNSDTWAISTACGDYTALLELVNYLYSEEGQLIYNWGEEDVTYTLDENGDPQWTDLVVNNPDGLNYMFASYLYATGIGSVYFPGVYDMEKGFYSYNDEQLAAVDTFADLTDGAYNLPNYVSLTLDETAEYNSYATDLETYADSEVLKFILGDRPISEVDDFVATLYTMGLQEMTDLYQAAYDRAQEALAEA
jgi:putative aldouronate transport system substrate-binding protein